MLSHTKQSHLACKIQWLPNAVGRGSGMAAGTRVPGTCPGSNQAPTSGPALAGVPGNHLPACGTPLPKRCESGSQLCSSCKRNPPKSSQGISPTTFSSTPKSNGFYCFLRSLQVLAVTSEGFGSRFQLAARYRMLSVPSEVLLNRAEGCSFLCLPSPCLLGRISSHPKQAWLPLFPKSLAS